MPIGLVRSKHTANMDSQVSMALTCGMLLTFERHRQCSMKFNCATYGAAYNVMVGKD